MSTSKSFSNVVMSENLDPVELGNCTGLGGVRFDSPALFRCETSRIRRRSRDEAKRFTPYLDLAKEVRSPNQSLPPPTGTAHPRILIPYRSTAPYPLHPLPSRWSPSLGSQATSSPRQAVSHNCPLFLFPFF